MSRKRKAFSPPEWMEPTSDNDWEPSLIPSAYSPKHYKPFTNNSKETKSVSQSEVESQSQVELDSQSEMEFESPSQSEEQSSEFAEEVQLPNLPQAEQHLSVGEAFNEPEVEITSEDEAQMVLQIHQDNELVDQVVLHENPHNDNELDELDELGEQQQEEEQEEDEGEGVNDVRYSDMMQKLSENWLLIELTHRVSKTATNSFWQLAKSHFHEMFKMKEEENVKRKVPLFSQMRRVLHQKHVPEISLEIGYQHRETGEITIVQDTRHTPTSTYPPHLYQKLYEQATVKVSLFSVHLNCIELSLNFHVS